MQPDGFSAATLDAPLQCRAVPLCGLLAVAEAFVCLCRAHGWLDCVHGARPLTACCRDAGSIVCASAQFVRQRRGCARAGADAELLASPPSPAPARKRAATASRGLRRRAPTIHHVVACGCCTRLRGVADRTLRRHGVVCPPTTRRGQAHPGGAEGASQSPRSTCVRMGEVAAKAAGPGSLPPSRRLTGAAWRAAAAARDHPPKLLHS